MNLLTKDSAYRLASNLLAGGISIENLAKRILEVQENAIEYFKNGCEFEMRVRLPKYPPSDTV